MAGTKQLIAPLIVESDPAAIEAFTQDPTAKKLPPLVASSGKDAQLILADYNRSFAGIFVNPAVVNPGALSVIRCAHQFHPATPMYLIYDEPLTFTERELKSLGIQKALKKPMTYGQMLALVGPLLATFEPNAALELSKRNKDSLSAEVAANDAQFLPIRANNFLAGSVSFFDVYVRLASGKYLKLLQAGDSFSQERLKTYIEKGVTHFYLRKEAQEQYVSYCDNLTAAIIKNQNIPAEIKVSQTLNQGEETLQFFREHGISDANLRYAANFVRNVNELIRQLKPERNSALREFMKDIAAFEHGAATTVIASLILHPLQITSLEPVETVGIASLLHDIGLRSLPEALRDEDDSRMSDQQKALFRKHPIEGAEILKSLNGMKPATLQAVVQHHERRTRKGYPYQLGPGSISLVSEIVGISDEFCRIIHKMKTNSKIDLHVELEKNIYNSFSVTLISEFKKIFNFDATTPAPKS